MTLRIRKRQDPVVGMVVDVHKPGTQQHAGNIQACFSLKALADKSDPSILNPDVAGKKRLSCPLGDFCTAHDQVKTIRQDNHLVKGPPSLQGQDTERNPAGLTGRIWANDTTSTGKKSPRSPESYLSMPFSAETEFPLIDDCN